MIKILDIYILKQFIQNFIFGVFCFLIIFILIDLFENLDKFIDKNVSSGLIFQYYIYFVPEILKLITPVGMLLASLFTTSRFVNYSELTAIQSSGISILRYLAPIFVFGILLTFFSVYFNGWIVPKSNSGKFQIERIYLGKHQIHGTIQNLYIQEQNNRIVSIGAYNEYNRLANNVSVQVFNTDSLNSMQRRLDIESMVWDSIKNDWKINNSILREFTQLDTLELLYNKESYVSDIKGIERINLSPGLIMRTQMRPEELSLTEHKEFINNLKLSGLESGKTEVDYYSKISFPFASLVTIIFGASISTHRRKSGAALQFGIAILVAFIYLGCVKIFQVIGANGDLNPVFTAWMANILFVIISAVNFYRTSKS